MEISGYPKYLVYPDGRVVNKKRPLTPLKFYLNDSGYWMVSLYSEGNEKSPKKMRVHRLIAIAYIPNPDNKPFIDHINRVRDDNRIENLRWVSHKENMLNMSMSYTNTSGYRHIGYSKVHMKWFHRISSDGRVQQRMFHTKIEALMYKFWFVLKEEVQLRSVLQS